MTAEEDTGGRIIDESELFALTYDTKTHSVNARTLADCLVALTHAVERASSTGLPNANFAIKVTAIEKGSLEVWFKVVEYVFAGTMSLGFDKIRDILESIKSYIEIKKMIGEAKIESNKEVDGGITITSNGMRFENCNIGTVNLLGDEIVAKTFARSMGSLKRDSVGNLSIITCDRNIYAQISKDDYEKFQRVKAEPEHPDRKEILDATLNVQKLILSGKGTWGFIYEGVQIAASIADNVFKKNLENGIYKFTNGDRLRVNLETTSRYDKSSDAYIIKSRKILKVLAHIPRQDAGDRSGPL